MTNPQPPQTKPAIPEQLGARMIEVFRRAVPRLPDDVKTVVVDLFTGDNLKVLEGVLAAWTAAHLIGVGELMDLGLLSLGILSLGTMAFDVSGAISRSIAKTQAAKTSADLDAAAVDLASAITLMGGLLFNAFIMRYAMTKGTSVRPSVMPQSVPRYYALTTEEWLYNLGFRQIAPRVRSGATTALEFFERRQSFASASDVAGWMKAMDLSNPVTLAGFDTGAELVGYMQVKPSIVAQLKANPAQFEQIMAQLKPGDFEVGRFFTKPGTALERLGIGAENRVFCRFRVNSPVEALESITAPAKDTWTVRAGFQETANGSRWYNGQLVQGGATQYLIPEARFMSFTGDLQMVSSGAGVGSKATKQIPRIKLY